MLVGGSHEQKKKYLGRMTEEPLHCVRNGVYVNFKLLVVVTL